MNTEELIDQKGHNTWSASGSKWSRDPKLARYMTLPSLLALLHRRKLHFTKLTDLRRYDAHEGVGGLMNNIIQTPMTSGSCMSPSTPEFEAEQAAIVERIKAELSLPYEEQWPKFKAQVAKWDQEYANVFVTVGTRISGSRILCGEYTLVMITAWHLSHQPTAWWNRFQKCIYKR